MILCVAGNPSIDKLFEVSEIVVGEIHRPDRMIALPGGKGIHVAQVATTLGGDAVVTGLLAGHTGRWVAQTLATDGVAGEWAWGVGETRSSLSVADRATGRLTEFYEDGEPVSGEEWHAVRGIVDSLLPAADWLVLAGSLPAGPTGYSQLIESAPAHGVRCAVDSRGNALAEAVDAGADLVKINIHEAAELLGGEFHGPAEAIRAARAIRERAGGDGHAVAVTLGDDGMVGVDFEGGGWRGTLGAHGRYPVGCGDSFLAGILVGFEQAGSWDEAAALALGTAAANAEMPGAGRLDPVRAWELAARAVISAV
jgi:1-phosphofructokinase family hexose kinase